MPVQTQMSSFAKKLGVRVTAANAEHKDKPVDLGMQRLPAGIKNGVAKLVTMVTKEYPDDKNGPGTKGQTFFRAAAVVISPLEHAGCKVAGLHTSQVIPLCDMPAKGMRKAVSFNDNWYEFQNLFKLLSIVSPSGPQYDLTGDPVRDAIAGQQIEAYYFAAMKTLCDLTRLPVYISFSTRRWTPPVTPAQPKPEEMVFEAWHGLAVWDSKPDPAAGISTQPKLMDPPPVDADGLSNTPADVVTELLRIIHNDSDGSTDEGVAAYTRLDEMAHEAGWTKEEIAGAADWAVVGEMALNPSDSEPDVIVGSRWGFVKRDRAGNKLKGKGGDDLPLQEVEIVTVNTNDETCTVKTTMDGRDMVDIRSKKPVAVKWEWLE